MTMSKGRAALAVALVLLVTVAASAAFVARAERTEKSKSGDKPKTTTNEQPDFASQMPKLSEDEMRDVVNVLELWTLSDKLELTDAQLVSLMPKYRRLKTMRERFWQSRPERYKSLGEQADAAGPTPTPDTNTRLRAAFDAFQKENDAFWSEHEKVRQEILKELTPRQQVAYLIWESESPRKTGRVLRALRKMGEMRQPAPPNGEARPPKREGKPDEAPGAPPQPR